MEADVVFCLTGDLRTNSRALRQMRALRDEGFSVVGLGLANSAAEEVRDGIRQHHLVRPPGRGPAWFWSVHRLFRRTLRRFPARVYHASDLFVLPAVRAAARTRKRPYTYDSRELYPHVGATVGKPWASRFWQTIETLSIRGASATFTVCEGIAERMASMYGIARPGVVWNVPEHPPAERGDYLRRWAAAEDHETLLLYQGYLKPGRGCGHLVEAVARVPETRGIFLGDGHLAAGIVAHAERLGVAERIHLHPAVPPDCLLDVTASADIGICLIEPLTESLRLSLPNKLFEYLWAGLPVVGSRLPEISRVVDQFDVGLTVDPFDADEVATAVARLVDDELMRRTMSANTSRVTETYAWRRASEVFLTPFRSLVRS